MIMLHVYIICINDNLKQNSGVENYNKCVGWNSYQSTN